MQGKTGILRGVQGKLGVCRTVRRQDDKTDGTLLGVLIKAGQFRRGISVRGSLEFSGEFGDENLVLAQAASVAGHEIRDGSADPVAGRQHG